MTGLRDKLNNVREAVKEALGTRTRQGAISRQLRRTSADHETGKFINIKNIKYCYPKDWEIYNDEIIHTEVSTRWHKNDEPDRYHAIAFMMPDKSDKTQPSYYTPEEPIKFLCFCGIISTTDSISYADVEELSRKRKEVAGLENARETILSMWKGWQVYCRDKPMEEIDIIINNQRAIWKEQDDATNSLKI